MFGFTPRRSTTNLSVHIRFRTKSHETDFSRHWLPTTPRKRLTLLRQLNGRLSKSADKRSDNDMLTKAATVSTRLPRSDTTLSWTYSVRERVTVKPSVGF